MTPEAASYLAKPREDIGEARQIAGIGLAKVAARSAYTNPHKERLTGCPNIVMPAEAGMTEETRAVGHSLRGLVLLRGISCCRSSHRREDRQDSEEPFRCPQ